jgi:DNA-binding Lrp family transcriptional regulator
MTRRKKKTQTFDERDEAIIHCIQQDPTILMKRIPTALENRGGPTIPYPTVQRRVKDLTKNKILDQRFSINWKEAGYLVRYRVGILIDPVALLDKSQKSKEYDSQEGLANYIMFKLVQADPFKNKLVVDDVHILLGGKFDLAIDFYARDDKTATQFIIDALRGLPGISNTASAKLAYSSKNGWLSKNGGD